VSHDLQQPLQSIIGFARLIQLKYSPQLDDQGLKYLDDIADAGNRMNKLIFTLLNYAQTGQDVANFSLVDCQAVLTQVTNNLEQAISESGAELCYSFMPSVWGDETLLIHLFQNLISNAIKFSQPDTPPQIMISVDRKHPAYWTFEFHDNGIGIAADHLTDIFKPFQRFQKSPKVPGTGIGLATCKKIVAAHGGTIQVNSTPGMGTNFWFTLPVVQNEQLTPAVEPQSPDLCSIGRMGRQNSPPPGSETAQQ